MTIASKANMDKWYPTGVGVLAYSPTTGEECSANPSDYWMFSPSDVLKDAENNTMVLVRRSNGFVSVEPENAPATLYAINVRTLTRKDGYTGSIDSPTFYLDSNVQGIVSEDHAKRIVQRWLEDTGLAVLDVTAVKVD
jgi:hypothetical protein